MGGVYNVRHAGPCCGQTSNQCRNRGMYMHDIEMFAFEQVDQCTVCLDVPDNIEATVKSDGLKPKSFVADRLSVFPITTNCDDFMAAALEGAH